MTSRSRHLPPLYTAVGVGVVLVATFGAITLTKTVGGGTSGPAPASASGGLSANPLGLNVGAWDYTYAANTSAGGGLDVMQPLLKAAGIRQFRYGAGSYSDYYDWQPNTSATRCLPDVPTVPYPPGCTTPASLSFSQFSQQAKAIGAESFVTVNYGSGTPALAAAWVTHAAHTPAESVALWEIGNETYGCWEVNNELARAPTYYRGYQPLPANSSRPNQTCPRTREGDEAGTKTLATSYAANALQFIRAMKVADPAARIGVPWALDQQVPGSFVPDSTEWDDTVLEAVGRDISFVDVHYYPFYFYGKTGGANPADHAILQALLKIPSVEASIRAKLDTYAPDAAVLVGETGVSSSATTASCTPVGALFAAGDVLSWLAAGAQSVDWWVINSTSRSSRCDHPGFGFFTSSVPPATETPYYGYLLASKLAGPHALLDFMHTSDSSDVLAFQSALPDGGHALAFINMNTGSTETVTFHASHAVSGTLRTWSYSAGRQDPANSTITTGTSSAAAITRGITLPAESITVLETQ